MVVRHFRAIRGNTKFKYSVLVVIIEANNNAFVADMLSRVVSTHEFQPVYVVSVDPKNMGRAGVYTTTQKPLYAEHLQRAFPFNVVLYKDFISKASESNKRKMKQQLLNFRRYLKPPAVPGSAPPREIISGKGHNMEDDVVMCYAMYLYWSYFIIRQEDFIETMRKHRWSLNPEFVVPL